MEVSGTVRHNIPSEYTDSGCRLWVLSLTVLQFSRPVKLTPNILYSLSIFIIKCSSHRDDPFRGRALGEGIQMNNSTPALAAKSKAVDRNNYRSHFRDGCSDCSKADEQWILESVWGRRKLWDFVSVFKWYSLVISPDWLRYHSSICEEVNTYHLCYCTNDYPEQSFSFLLIYVRYLFSYFFWEFIFEYY